MARAPRTEPLGEDEPDAIPGVASPRRTFRLVGHGDAEAALLEAWRGTRLHHAWLVTGPRGIGKATLAFRFARFVLAGGTAAGERLPDETDPRTDRLVAGGAHPNLLHLHRPYDEKRKRFATLLTVDEIRRIGRFIGTTPAGGGHRIVIVDAADDMNPAAANALLKALEEPPRRTLFLVLSHAPGRLLPTIRSRCRQLPLRPLSEAAVREAIGLTEAGALVSADDAATAARLADGSVRRALRLAVSGAVEIAREIDRLFEGDRAADRAVRLALADRIAGDRDEETFRIAADVLRDRVVETVRTGARAGEPLSALDALSRFAGTLESRRRTLEIYNLDRKQFLLDAFADLAALLRPARTGGSPRA